MVWACLYRRGSCNPSRRNQYVSKFRFMAPRRPYVLIPPQCNIQQHPASPRQERQDFLPVEEICVVAEFFHFFRKIGAELLVIPFMDRHAEALLFPANQF